MPHIPRFRMLLAVCMLVLFAAACAPEEAVTLEITSPSDGESIEGNVVTLTLSVSGIEIVPADGDTSGETGHFHVFIDRDPVEAGETIPRESGIVHSPDNPLTLTGLGVGEHRFGGAR